MSCKFFKSWEDNLRSPNEDTIDDILSGQLQITKRVFAKIFTSHHIQNLNIYMMFQFLPIFQCFYWSPSAANNKNTGKNGMKWDIIYSNFGYGGWYILEKIKMIYLPQ